MVLPVDSIYLLALPPFSKLVSSSVGAPPCCNNKMGFGRIREQAWGCSGPAEGWGLMAYGYLQAAVPMR